MGSPATSSAAIPLPVPNRVLDDPDDWEYFSEGANNVLYRYVGADSFFVRVPSSLLSVLPLSLFLTSSDLDPEIVSAPSPKSASRLADNSAAA